MVSDLIQPKEKLTTENIYLQCISILQNPEELLCKREFAIQMLINTEAYYAESQKIASSLLTILEDENAKTLKAREEDKPTNKQISDFFEVVFDLLALIYMDFYHKEGEELEQDTRETVQDAMYRTYQRVS